MKKTMLIIGIAALLSVTASLGPARAAENDLVVKTCPELMRMAEQSNEDLRTVDMVLGSAIDSGTMDRIKSYKLRKSAVRQQLNDVVKALEIKGCVCGKQ
jgi:hypothetical protein